MFATDIDLNDISPEFFNCNCGCCAFCIAISPDMDDSILNEMQKSYSKPMDQWNNQEVLNFIHNTVDTETLSLRNITLENFQCISGFIFKNLDEHYCKILSNSNETGTLIFRAKEDYNKCHPTSEYIGQEDSPQQEHRVFGDELDVKTNNKRPGRPRCKPISDRIGKRSEKLWEFLLHLLRDDKTCPHLIKWENFEEGTFRFVQSDKVARLWGSRKKNENMTYEKFSRAMRYYYKSQVLLPVPGRRLVYKFGPQAKGWKSITPINK